LKLLFNNGNQHVGGNGAPDLRLHRILAVADKAFDAQMLLDPLEEQFDLPAIFVQRGNRQGGQSRIVGEKDQGLASSRVFEADAPQLLGIRFGRVVTVQCDALIADDAGGSIGWHRVHPVRVHATLGAGDEERAGLMQGVQSGEIQIAPVHHVECARLDGQDIQHTDLVGLAIADVEEGGNVATQIQQGMQFDAALAERNGAQGNSDKHKSMVVASSA
jgi:hypothetical protein